MTATTVLQELGWALNTGKTEGPAQELTFLGVQINSVNQTLSLPRSRVEAYIKSLDDLLESSLQGVSAHQLLSMAGKLQWLSSVFLPGRTHLVDFYRHAHYMESHRRFHGPLPPNLRTELLWWKGQLEYLFSTYDTKPWSRFWLQCVPTPIQLFSDASGEDNPSGAAAPPALGRNGFGAVCQGVVYRGVWKNLTHKTSGYAELVPLLLVLQHQGKSAANSVLLVTTGNLGSAFATNRGVSNSRPTVGTVKEIQELALSLNIG